MVSPSNTMRGLSPLHGAQRPSKPAAPPAPPDKAEIGSKLSTGITFASLAGLCLMAGTSIVQAQVAPTPAADQQDLTLSEQLTQAAQKQGISLEFEVRPPKGPPISVTPWHAEKIMAEAGSVVVKEVKDGQFDRSAFLTDTVDLVAYTRYMEAATPETPEEHAATSLRAFFNLTPDTQIVHPRTQESLSPFTASRLLKEDRPLLLRMDGMPEKQLNNLKELERTTNPAPGCDLTNTWGGGQPGVYCLFGH